MLSGMARLYLSLHGQFVASLARIASHSRHFRGVAALYGTVVNDAVNVTNSGRFRSVVRVLRSLALTVRLRSLGWQWQSRVSGSRFL